MEIGVTVKGGKKLKSFLKTAELSRLENLFKRLGQKGVDALASATPVDTGLTASSWYYEFHIYQKGAVLYWKNDNYTKDGTPIPVLIQYGYTTGTGGWVEGRDFINPAIMSIFDDILVQLSKEMNYG